MSYLQCLLILIGSLFILNTDATIYCNASTTLNSLSGRIEEPIGGGNYRDQFECVWILNSPNSANFLTVQFLRFDLEYGYDYVTISSGDFQTRWHGYQLPQPLAVPVVSGSPVRISFATDQLVTFTGFALTYSFTTCSNPCLNGYCSNGQCICYPGWNGATCEQSYCPNNCGGHGTCQLNQCECNAGYTGADCTQLSPQHCSGLIPITATFGNFTDHTPWYLPYKGNTNCKWLISTGSTGPVTIATALHQFDWFDSLTVYDGDSESSPRLGSLSYSGFAVSPLISRVSSGNLFVVFSSDDNAEYTGFTALFSRNDQCPNSCSGNGYCIEGKCACFNGKMGISCDQDSIATPLTKDQLIKDYANDFEWKYYSYSFPCNTKENTRLTFQTRKLIDTPPSTTYSSHWKWGGGDLVYLLGFNYLPSFARNMGGKSYWQYPPDLEIQNPSCNGTYYVAIYGREASYFTIRPTFEASPTSAPSVDNSNNIPTQSTTPGSEQSSEKKRSNIGLIAGVVIVVVSLVLFAITAVSYYFFKVRRANAGPRFEMVPTEEPDE